jgi:hypothetical protein
MIFLPIELTYDIKNEEAELPFIIVDYYKEFGLEGLDELSLNKFKLSLINDNKMAYNFLVSKVGYNYRDE